MKRDGSGLGHDSGIMAARRVRRVGLGAGALAVVAALIVTQTGGASPTPTPTPTPTQTTPSLSVPGVDNGSDGMATVFSCTNGGTAAASVTVSLFEKGGAPGPTRTASIAVNATVNFATASVKAFTVDVNLGAPTMSSGSASISAPSGVFCAAFITDASHDPPSVMVSLPVDK
jgi:hypothetical protein